MDDFNIEGKLPTFITPKNNIKHIEECSELIHNQKEHLQKLLLSHGGLVFRGFPLETSEHFDQFIKSLNLGQYVNYIGGDSPRDKVKNKIYTSTEAPPNLHIPLHQELSFIKNFPRHIYFFCEIEPSQGGSTIIADARQVLNAISPKIKDRFHEKGLTYISHYYYKSKIMNLLNRIQRSHKSWTEVFETQDKNRVEEQCLKNEFEWRWLPRDWIEIKQTRPALLNHPLTNESVWFNQAHLYDFNPKLLGWKKYLGAKLFYFRSSTRLHDIYFGDGSRVPRKDLYHILDTLNENTVSFPWKKGDVMVLDNILAMHGRAPFSGKRRILTALTA